MNDFLSILFVHVILKLMSIERITLLTGNQDKLRIAQNVFREFGIDIDQADLDIPEIQAETSEEIAVHQVREAYRRLRQPVIREDHSLFIDAINFPGPFMAYANRSIPVPMLLRMMSGLPSRAAHFEIAGAYADSLDEPFVTSFQVPVEIATEARGNTEQGWDTVLKFPDRDTTFAEEVDENDGAWDVNYRRIARHILSRRG